MLHIVFGILSFAIGAVCLVVAGACFAISYLFEHKPEQVGRSTGTLRDAKYKKDVPIYGRSHIGGPIRIVCFIKHLTKAKYDYPVNGKTYRIKDRYFGRLRETPRLVSVAYLKKFPFIAYIKDYPTESSDYALFAFGWFCGSVAAIASGCAFLFWA